MTPIWNPDQVRVDELTRNHLWRWIQAPGNRGVLHGFWTDSDGTVAVVTSVGIGHYKPDTLTWVAA